MKSIAYILIVACLCFISFYLGAQKGIQEFWAADAQYKAATISSKLEHLNNMEKHGIESVSIENLRLELEGDLNFEFLQHHNGLGSKWLWLLSGKLGSSHQDAFIDAVRYRIENPWKYPVDEIAGENKEKMIEANLMVQEVLDYYQPMVYNQQLNQATPARDAASGAP